MDKPTPEQIAKASLASLNKSVSVGSSSKPSDMQIRDAKLKAQPSYAQPEWTRDDGSKISPASTTMMARLWQLMTELYGHKWTSVHGLADESGNWGKVLGGIDGRQLAEGIRRCTQNGDPWPPSAPEFRALCESGRSSLCIPDVASAWREAVEACTDPTVFKFSHPIVHEAARLTDWYSIRTGTPKAETVQNRFNKRYADLTAKLQRGEPLVAGQLLLNQEAALDEIQKSDQANESLIKQRIKDQGLDKKTPEQLRAELREKLGLKP